MTLISTDLTRIVIVDNLKESFELQRDNGIEISSWFGDTLQDQELIKLSVALDCLLAMTDIREGIRKMNSDLEQFKLESNRVET